MNNLKIIYLLPLLLISGPFLSDTLVTISSIYFLIFLVTKKKKFLINKFFIFFLLLSFILFLISSLNSHEILISLKSSMSYIRFFVFSFLIFYLMDQKILKERIFIYTIGALITILFLDACFQFTTGSNIIGFKSLLPYRITSFFGDEALLGNFVFKIYIIFFLLLHSIDFKNKNIFFILITLFAFLTVIISGDRTPSILFIIFLVLAYARFYKYKYFNYSIFLVLFLSSFFIFLSPTLKNRHIYMTTQGFIGSLDNFTHENIIEKMDYKILDQNFKNIKFLSDHHYGHFLIATEIVKDNLILGSGPRTFRYLCQKEKYQTIKNGVCSTHPHNFYLQIFSETGILGFILLLSLFLFALKNYINCIFNKKKTTQYFLFNINLILLLFPLAPSGDFFNNWSSILNFLPLGFYFYYLKDNFQIKII